MGAYGKPYDLSGVVTGPSIGFLPGQAPSSGQVTASTRKGRQSNPMDRVGLGSSGTPGGGRGSDVRTSSQGAYDLTGPSRKILLGE